MTTEGKIYWAVGIMSAIIGVGAFFIPEERGRTDDVPWHIEHVSPDSSRVFGLDLGRSSTNDAEQRFKEEAVPSLFKSPEGKLVAEVFFEQVNLAGLPAKVVLTIAVPAADLEAMYERGLRLASTGDGKKVTMTPDDIAKLRTMPITSLTYLPSLRVEEAIFQKRFGQPAQRIREKKSGLVHWLYPKDGLDIMLNANEKPVLQYVAPRDFDKVAAPLVTSGEVLN